VILVGDDARLETIALALTAAELGLLVLATLQHKVGVATIGRVAECFPADQQPPSGSHCPKCSSASARAE
jgi:twitching motility protein PilT